MLQAYFTGVAEPAIIVFCTDNVVGILLSVGYPLLASINKPIGHPIITELKIDSEEFLRI